MRATIGGLLLVESGALAIEKRQSVDVDDLMALSLGLGVTPNTLLLPQVEYLSGTDTHLLTPEAGGTAERLWQWAQGERPLLLRIPGSAAWIGDGEHPALDFAIRTRPYLTSLRSPGGGRGMPPSPLRDLSAAVQKALKAGAAGTEVRRVVELTLALPVLMTDAEIDLWLEDGTRPEGS